MPNSITHCKANTETRPLVINKDTCSTVSNNDNTTKDTCPTVIHHNDNTNKDTCLTAINNDNNNKDPTIVNLCISGYDHEIQTAYKHLVAV